MPTSSPLRVAPRVIRWTLLGRCPTDVNICGRVSTILTGRRSSRAAATVRMTCGHTRRPAPNPPPTYGTSTRTALSGTSKTAASVVRTSDGHWVVSCTVRRSPSQAARVANGPSGLLVWSGVV